MTRATNEISRQIAQAALELGAIKLQPQDPFTWASGYRMPIYNDNRRLLSHYENRCLVVEGFTRLVQSAALCFDLIAGTATGGIAPATSLADQLKTRFVYVRQAAKQHGTRSKIEGVLAPGERVLLVEDLVSTAGSSIAAVQGLRAAGALVEHCLAIFSYGFAQATAAFADQRCALHVLLTLDQLLVVAREQGCITDEESRLLDSWQQDPFAWGAKHGFPRSEQA